MFNQGRLRLVGEFLHLVLLRRSTVQPKPHKTLCDFSGNNYQVLATRFWHPLPYSPKSVIFARLRPSFEYLRPPQFYLVAREKTIACAILDEVASGER